MGCSVIDDRLGNQVRSNYMKRKFLYEKHRCKIILVNIKVRYVYISDLMKLDVNYLIDLLMSKDLF